MAKNKINNTLVGFFPVFENLAETGRAVLIAKKYQQLGGKTIFFSHGGKYEFLAEKNNFKIIKVKPLLDKTKIKEYTKIADLEKFSSKKLLKTKWLLKNVLEEIKAYEKTKIKLLVSTNNFTSAISARAAKIPYINVIPGSGFFNLKIPEALESPFVMWLPKRCKTKLLNIFLRQTKWFCRPLNKVCKKTNVPPFKKTLDIFKGDYTLVTNYLDFINIYPNQQEFPDECYIGMIQVSDLINKKNNSKESKKSETEIIKHINKKEGSILLTLGSSGTKEFYLKILKTLNKTNYRVIAVYTSILEESDIPKLKENILLKKFIPSITKINKLVDIAIIHGGQGTVFNCVYSKKPAIGIPMTMEQQLNLEKLVGHGSCIMVSRRFFKEKKLTNAINKIFNNYEFYQKNANKLAKKIPPAKGDEKAAKKIYEIVLKKT